MWESGHISKWFLRWKNLLSRFRCLWFQRRSKSGKRRWLLHRLDCYIQGSVNRLLFALEVWRGTKIEKNTGRESFPSRLCPWLGSEPEGSFPPQMRHSHDRTAFPKQTNSSFSVLVSHPCCPSSSKATLYEKIRTPERILNHEGTIVRLTDHPNIQRAIRRGRSARVKPKSVN